MSGLPIGGPTPAQLLREEKQRVENPELTDEQLEQVWAFIVKRAGKGLMKPVIEAGVGKQMVGRTVGLDDEGYVDPSLVRPISGTDLPPITEDMLPPITNDMLPDPLEVVTINTDTITAGTVNTDILTADIAAVDKVTLADGTEGAPSLTFIGDTDTGMYHPTANQVGITTAGVARLTVSTAAVTSNLQVISPAFRGNTSFGGGTINAGMIQPHTNQAMTTGQIIALGNNRFGFLIVFNSTSGGLGMVVLRGTVAPVLIYGLAVSITLGTANAINVALNGGNVSIQNGYASSMTVHLLFLNGSSATFP